MKYFFCGLVFLLLSCGINNNKPFDYKSWEIKRDNRALELAKEYGINYLLDTIDIRYTIEGDFLLKEKALMIRSGTINDIVKKNDSTYIIKNDIYSFFVDLETNDNELIEFLLNKNTSDDSFLIVKLDTIYQIDIKLLIYGSEHQELIEVEAETHDRFIAKGKMLYYENFPRK